MQNRHAPKTLKIVMSFGALTAIVIGVVIALSGNQTQPQPATSSPVVPQESKLNPETIELAAGTNKEYTLAATPVDTSVLPNFVTSEAGKLILQPVKVSGGEHNFTLTYTDGRKQDFTIKVTRPAVDWAGLEQEILSTLGSKRANYGVWIEDLIFGGTYQLNPLEVYLPGSMAKLPVVILTLRDIDAGKYTFDDTFPVKDKNKHSRSDSIGRLAAGTNVKIKDYIYYTIHESNNSAMYSLRDMLGGVEVVDQRTKAELGAYTYHDAPGHIAIAADVGKVIGGLYRGEYLSQENTDYLITLMKETLPSLREAIPAGIPDKALPVANKVGFLNTKDGTAYGDIGIVYGKTTDFLIIVLDRNTSWDEGRNNAKKIAGIAYKYLN